MHIKKLAVAFQARAKEQRDSRRALLSGVHRSILELVANRLNLDTATVEDFILDGQEVKGPWSALL